MANFIPSKKVASDFNNGTAFKSGDVVQAETMNNVVEGVLYSQNASDSAVNIANSANDTAKNAQQTANEALEIAQQGGGGTGGGAVTSVNGKIGAVTITKTDIGLENVDNVKQYSISNPPPYPVTSVNSQTGAVTISKYNLGLAEVAITGSYNDLEDKPDFSTENLVKKAGDSDIGRLTFGNINTTHSSADYNGFTAGVPSIDNEGYYAVYGADNIKLIHSNMGSSSAPIRLELPKTAGEIALKSDIQNKITVGNKQYTILVNNVDEPFGDGYITLFVEGADEKTKFTINVISIQGSGIVIASSIQLLYDMQIQLENGAVLTVVSVLPNNQYFCTTKTEVELGEYNATIIGG